ncbi:terminase large subunit [Candidatus Pacearchaeota archaeon]|nr:terminase large subunit [Candidatus Pacearchaeota archaeon]
MIDYKNPNYSEILAVRATRLLKIRKDPKLLTALKIHYKTHPWDFVSDWGMTFDPRNIEKGLPAIIPFVLFPRQTEYLQWLYKRWQAGERALNEKTRDFGATWLAAGFAVSMFIFYPGFAVGFGSRKEALVDKKGDPKCIFEKVRMLIDYLPKEFMPEGFNRKLHSNFMKIINPENESTITGEAGDDIGRGARMSIYFVDEAAFIERQESVDSALSQTTNCQIDISTPNGNGNLFYRKRHSGKLPVFVMDWHDDPRKDQAWYDKQVIEQSAATVAQEIDRDYDASIENVFIPSKWVKAAVDAHITVGFEAEGQRTVGQDIADEGEDSNAMCYTHGSIVEDLREWHKGDTGFTAKKSFNYASACGARIVYDSIGVGAGCKAKYNELNVTRADPVVCIGFNAGAKVINPKKLYKPGKTNGDMFANLKAQTWWAARDRFENTYLALTEGRKFNADEMISLSSDIELLDNLISELARPQIDYDNNGRVKVESKKDMKKRGIPSPNLADSFIMSIANCQQRQAGVLF